MLDLKVKKSSILLAVYLFSMFLPGYFSSPIMQMVSNIMMVGVAIYLFSVKYKPSRFMILTICYFAYLIAITFIYHNKAADVHLIISNLKIVFMLCAIEYLLKRTPDSTINIMFFISSSLLFSFLAPCLNKVISLCALINGRPVLYQ